MTRPLTTKPSTVVRPCVPEVLAVVTRVGKRYGATTALENVSLTLYPGEVVALLGPNGAGKATLFQLLLGLTRPDKGRVTLFGSSPRTPSARRTLGSTLQQSGFPEALTVREVVKLVQAHYPVRSDAHDLLERFGLGNSLEREVGGLSGGQQRTLASALAFAGRPELVLLDEPTTGLDADARRRLWDELRRYADEGGSVLLATHDLAEAEVLARRVVLLHRGRVLADEPLVRFKARVGLKRATFSTQLEPLPTLPGVEARSCEDGRVHLETRDADALVRALCAQRVPFTDLEVAPLSLEATCLACFDGSYPAGHSYDGEAEEERLALSVFDAIARGVVTKIISRYIDEHGKVARPGVPQSKTRL